jgi:SAM-dependent methyltransferase
MQRSIDSLRHQFEVEQDLARRLRHSTREGRTELFKTLYGELFQRVPDHPRLTRRDTPESSATAVRSQMQLLKPVLKPDVTLLEFAPGDCRLSKAAAAHCSQVIGVDISDQRSPTDSFPENFQLLVYDGYTLPLPDASVDAVFSYQFLEHLHPDDVAPHFAQVSRVLKKGGVYILDTPHRHSGPHDIARYFTTDLVCLHMREWTYKELRKLGAEYGLTQSYAYRRGKPLTSALTNAINDAGEAMLGILPAKLRQKASARLYAGVTLMLQKA